MIDLVARRGPRLALLLAPLLAAVIIVWARSPDAPPDAIDITATGPSYSTLDELINASDLVIAATITNATPGRIVTDPTNPDAGIRTTIFTLEPNQETAATSDGNLTIEYETQLLDGTPITVNGIRPPTVGEKGLYFLIQGPTDDFPHYAIINDQGRYIVNSSQRLVALSSDNLATTAIAGEDLDTILQTIGES